MSKYDVEIEIEPGLKYTEETGRSQRTLPVRDCLVRVPLWCSRTRCQKDLPRDCAKKTPK